MHLISYYQRLWKRFPAIEFSGRTSQYVAAPTPNSSPCIPKMQRLYSINPASTYRYPLSSPHPPPPYKMWSCIFSISLPINMPASHKGNSPSNPILVIMCSSLSTPFPWYPSSALALLTSPPKRHTTHTWSMTTPSAVLKLRPHTPRSPQHNPVWGDLPALTLPNWYRVITLFFKQYMVIYPYFWRIMHNSCYPQFWKHF